LQTAFPRAISEVKASGKIILFFLLTSIIFHFDIVKLLTLDLLIALGLFTAKKPHPKKCF